MTLSRKALDTGLAEAVMHADSAGVAVFLARGANPDACNDIRQPLLVIAAGTGDTRIVRQLIGAGANVDIADGSCLTALHSAIAHGFFATAECLLQAKADINAQILPDRSVTPLHTAVSIDSSEGIDDRVRFLLARGADITRRAFIGVGIADQRGNAIEQALAQPHNRGAYLADLLSNWQRMCSERDRYAQVQTARGMKLKL